MFPKNNKISNLLFGIVCYCCVLFFLLLTISNNINFFYTKNNNIVENIVNPLTIGSFQIAIVIKRRGFASARDERVACEQLDSPTHIEFWGDWILQPILSSELFILRCGLEFRAICISMWLGVPSYLYFAVAWSSEPSYFFLLSQDWKEENGKEKNKLRNPSGRIFE